MKIFKNTEYPKKATDLKGIEEEFSEDVIIYTEHDMLNIGFWNYDTKKWMFHTNTFIDPYEDDEIFDFVWMYKPNELNIEYTNLNNVFTDKTIESPNQRNLKEWASGNKLNLFQKATAIIEYNRMLKYIDYLEKK